MPLPRNVSIGLKALPSSLSAAPSSKPTLNYSFQGAAWNSMKS